MAKRRKATARRPATEPRTGVRFETYADSAGEHRWRLVDGNNRIVATSGEGYTRAEDATRAQRNVVRDIVAAAHSMVTVSDRLRMAADRLRGAPNPERDREVLVTQAGHKFGPKVEKFLRERLP